MYWFKSCPRCRGDLHVERDIYSTEIVCMQCGHILNRAQVQALLERTMPRALRTRRAEQAPVAMAS